MNKERIAVIAGAAGFIGSHLTEKLITQEGYKVYGVDNFVTGSHENIDYLSQFPEFEFIEHDIKEPLKLPNKIDAVYDFACPASPTDFDRLKMNILEANSLGIYNLLQLARANEATFVFSSSSEVYGDAEINPQREDYNGNVNTTGIRAIYDEGKRFGESMVMAFHRSYGLPTRIVRIFNTYGERMRSDDGRAIPTFINQAILNTDVTIFGDGKQTRSPQYVSDLVSGIIKLAKSDVTSPVNIGNPDEMSIQELAQRIIALSDSGSKIIYKELPHIHDPKVRKPDISKAKNELNWSPEVPFDAGMKKTIEWFRYKLQAE
jgi:dTDP-glucose 4,6-dehydratase